MNKLLLTTALFLGMSLPVMALENHPFPSGQCSSTENMIATATGKGLDPKSITDHDQVERILVRVNNLNDGSDITGDEIIYVISNDIVDFVVIKDGEACAYWNATKDEWKVISAE